MPIYADHNATTPIRQEVKDEIVRCLDVWANPSSQSTSGKEAKAVVETARKQIADAVDVVFTSGGTEANHLAVHSAISLYKGEGKAHVITTTIEHDAIRKPLLKWQEEGRCDVTFVSPNPATGAVDCRSIFAAIRPDTILITVMMANNETGVIQPIEELSLAIEELNTSGEKILFHTDAAQALGKIQIDASIADYTTIVGHKFYGPRIGALIVRNLRSTPHKLSPIFVGGGQENGNRAGTENTPMIAGLGVACSLGRDDLDVTGVNAKVKKVRDYFEEKVVNTLANTSINFRTSDRLPNTSSVSFGDCANGKTLLAACKSFTASTGAACHSNATGASTILLASGVSEEAAGRTVRFSFGISSTEEDMDTIVHDLMIELARTK